MEDIIKLHNKKFRIMIPAAKIDEAVAAVACRINEDYRDKPTPLFVGVLNGSFMFMSDLIKKIEFNNELSFVKLASYEGTCSTGCVKNLIGLNSSIEGRHVIIVEDIVDTGESIEHMIGELKSHNPASIEVCTLFFQTGFLPQATADQVPRHGDRQRVHRGLRPGLRPVGTQPEGYLRGYRIDGFQDR